MGIFRNKVKEDALENEIRNLVDALGEAKGQRDGALFAISAHESVGSRLQKEIEEVGAQCEAYKADNLILISRIAQLQEQVAQLQGENRVGEMEYSELAETCKALCEAAAKAKKKKTPKKKRK